MCHHRGDIPGEIPEYQAEPTADDDELPEFLNADGEEVSVLTDGGSED